MYDSLNMMKKILLITLIVGIYGCSTDQGPTALDPPVAEAATFVTSNHFTANWNNSAGASEYELDIDTAADFSSNFGSITNTHSGTIVFGLDSMTQYFYRVRATLNNRNPSGNSNVISVYTLPVQPEATEATNVLSDGFTANWNEVAGISNYLLYLSTDNFASDPPVYVTGYDGKEVTGTTHDVTGLTAKTIYYYALKSKGDNSTSFFSNSIFVETAN